jgi:heavy metal efflux system protein
MLWLFLGHTRAALITAINIPLALMIAFIGMVSTGTPANLISLGAVDFGIVVDSTVIMVENIFRHLGPDGEGSVLERIQAAAREVAPSMLSSTLIIGTAFIPLFTLTGVAGVIFSPMAHTYAFAIGGAMVLAVTLTPVLAARGIPLMGDGHHEENWLVRALSRLYGPLFRFAIARKRLALLLVVAPVVLVFGLSSRMGREFMPKLEEGNFWIRATLPTSISLDQSARYVGRMRAILLGCREAAGGGASDGGGCAEGRRRHPEITTVVSQLGRPDDGTDVSGFYNIEIFAPLKPSNEWRPGISKDSMTEELSRELGDAFPGVVFNFSQMISDNVEEAMSGVKGENTVKVIGPDLRVNEAKAIEVQNALATVPGIQDLGIFRSLGQPNVRITPDRTQCGRYGLNVGDVEQVVQAAIGGQAITQVFEGEKHFDLTVRWAGAFRKDLQTVRSILVAGPDGTQVPLGQLAEIVEEEGPSLVYREDLRRYTPVKFSVRGRDLASVIAEAQKKIAEAVRLPYDTHLEWAGEINQLNETTDRLAIIIPLTLLLIAFLVFSSVRNLKDMVVVLAGIPCACSGGVLALLITHTTFSISAAMGFISIFGIAIQDALIVVSYAQRLWGEGVGIEEGARLAATRRLRPVLMTTFVAMIGLLPAALSHGIGSETQKPLAIVVIGGALMLAILPRLLQPALLVLMHAGERRSRVNASG